MPLEVPENPSGYVFNIQRYSIHDGPGIRTSVFLKGCPIRCYWCQNPESHNMKPEILLKHDLCTRCGACVTCCPEDANRIGAESSVIDRKKCIGCGECALVCPTEARVLEGREMTADEVMAIVVRDRAMYEQSGGGMTLSGGECTMQPVFSFSLLRKCKELGIHTAMETCGFIGWEVLDQLLDYTDYVLYDLKELDSSKHKNGTGVGNEVILQNAKKLAQKAQKCGIEVVVRTPMIPGYNDTPDDVRQTLQFITKEMQMPAATLKLLKYNKYAEGKYDNLDRGEGRTTMEPQTPEYMEMLNQIIQTYNT